MFLMLETCKIVFEKNAHDTLLHRAWECKKLLIL